jgi:hypothetical protein
MVPYRGGIMRDGDWHLDHDLSLFSWRAMRRGFGLRNPDMMIFFPKVPSD